MKSVALLWLLFAFTGAAIHAQAAELTGTELMELCTLGERRDDAAARKLCRSVITSTVAGASHSAISVNALLGRTEIVLPFCVPNPANEVELVRSVQRFIDTEGRATHDAEGARIAILDDPASSVIVRAMTRFYPCKKAEAPVSPD